MDIIAQEVVLGYLQAASTIGSPVTGAMRQNITYTVTDKRDDTCNDPICCITSRVRKSNVYSSQRNSIMLCRHRPASCLALNLIQTKRNIG